MTRSRNAALRWFGGCNTSRTTTSPSGSRLATNPDPEALARIHAHIDVCVECQECIVQVTRAMRGLDSDLMIRRVRSPTPNAPTEPAVDAPRHGAVVGRYVLRHRWGSALRRQRRDDEALTLFESVLRVRLAKLGSQHPLVANCYTSIGALQYHRGRTLEARDAYLAALPIDEEALGRNHPDVARVTYNLGLARIDLGEYQEARAELQRAFDIWLATVGPEHPNISYVHTGLGTSYLYQEAYAEARPHYTAALAISEARLGAEHPQTAACLVNLGEVELAMKRYPEAAASDRRALAIFEKAFGPKHPDLAFALTGLGKAELGAGRARVAIEHLDRASALRSSAEVLAIDRADTQFALARALWQANTDRPRAIVLATAAAAAWRDEHGPRADKQRREIAAWLAAHAAP